MLVDEDHLPYTLEDSCGIVHLQYAIRSVDDVVSKYSVEGIELMSDELAEFIEEAVPFFPHTHPLVLEITGMDLTAGQKETMENAVWNHYHLRLCSFEDECRHQKIQMIWFSVFLLLSSVLLFMVTDSMENLTVQFMYVPFWFFGYRILDYLILQLYPIDKTLELYRQLASMKVVFSGKDALDEFSETEATAIIEEITENQNDPEDSSFEEIQEEYFVNGDTTDVKCALRSLDDVISPHSIPGYEILSPEFSSFLDKLRPYIVDNMQVVLIFTGMKFQPEEQQTIRRCVKISLGFLLAEAEAVVKRSLRKITIFLILLVLSSLLLIVTKDVIDPAIQEGIVMIFWFFADYLIEYIVIEYVDTLSNRNKARQLTETEIRFL